MTIRKQNNNNKWEWLFGFIHWDDGGESNGRFLFEIFRLLLNIFSRENRFDGGLLDWIDGEEIGVYWFDGNNERTL